MGNEGYLNKAINNNKKKQKKTETHSADLPVWRKMTHLSWISSNVSSSTNLLSIHRTTDWRIWEALFWGTHTDEVTVTQYFNSASKYLYRCNALYEREQQGSPELFITIPTESPLRNLWFLQRILFLHTTNFSVFWQTESISYNCFQGQKYRTTGS